MLQIKDRQDRLFIGVIALVHVAFFLMALCYTRIYMGDSYEYIYEALNIKSRFFFYSGNAVLPIDAEYMTQRQPGYPLFLLLVYLFTTNNWLVLVLQNLLSMLNIYYCRSLIQKIGYEKRHDWLLLLLVIGYPSQFINANTIDPDILLQSFTLLYAGSYIRLLQSKDIRFAVHLSVALIAGFMVKPVLYPFAIVHVALVLIPAIAWKIKMQRPLLLALIPILAVLLYNYSNYTRTGKFHFSSNQAFNAVYYFNNYYSSRYGVAYADSFLSAERQLIAEQPSFPDRYDLANAEGKRLLRANMLPYTWFHLRRSARIFIEPGKAEIDLFSGKLTYGQLYSKQPAGFYVTLKKDGIKGLGNYIRTNATLPLIALILLLNCLRTIGLLLFLRCRNVALPVRIFIFTLLAYFAIAAGPIANTRYFLPVSLLSIGCAAIGAGRSRWLSGKQTL